MLMTLVGKTWKMMPRGTRVWLARRFQPKFTFSAGGIVTNERGEVLLLDHVLRPASGWGIPGGFIEKGEQADAALVREVMEETGLALRNVSFYRMRTLGRHIEVIYTATGVGEASVCSFEIKRLAWFAIEDIPSEMSLDQQFMIRRALGMDE